ncbi:MAG TPA: hypothetical protein VGL26_09670 [Jatrophihabitans sp.]|jgi:hypothetical protein
MTGTPPKRTPARWLILLGIPVLLAGALGFGLGSGSKAAWSFILGFAAALLAASAAVVLTDIASRIAPGMGLVMALLNYVLTVGFFLILALTVTTDSVDRTGFATGLAGAVIPYVGWQLVRAQRHVG